jgi:hypothetical protein
VSPRTKEIIALNEDKLATLLVKGEALEVSRLLLYWEWINKLQLTQDFGACRCNTCWWSRFFDA